MTDTSALVDLVLDDVVQAIRLGRSVLVQAALQGHGDVLRYLLNRISSSSSSSDGTPSPDQPELSKALSDALLGAAEQGHSHCLSALLESCASFLKIDRLVNARNELGDTAQMVAAKFGRGDCAKTLLQTQVAAANKRGYTALIMAAWEGHAECVSHLLQHIPETQVAAAKEEGDTALIMAASRGHAGCVSQLLQHIPETQVAADDRDGTTALMLAAEEGHDECVTQLLQHIPETQVAAADSGGGTALAAAVWSNHPDCVALLLAHSPSTQIAALDGDGQSVLEIAADLGHPQCLDLLLAHDPQPQHLDAAWLSALRQWDTTHARTSPHMQCLEQLHAKGALLPASAQEADKAKNRLFLQGVGSRALVADRVNEAMVGLALSVSGNKRKAGQEEA